MKKRMTALALACGLLLCGCSRAAGAEETAQQTETVLTEVTAAESIPAEGLDPIVLAYSEKTYNERTYDAPAEYRYNEAGQMVRKIQEQWNRVTEYEYHDNGALRRETGITDGAVEWINEFDDRGNLVQMMVPDGSGEMVTDCVYTNTYDDLGRLTEVTETRNFQFDDLVVQSLQTTSYHFRDDGSYEVEWYCRNYENGQLFPHCHWKETYDAQGTLLKRVRDLDNTTEIMNVTVYTLDAYGNPVRCSWKHSDDGCEYGSETEYENVYTADGKLSRVRKYKSSYRKSESNPAEEQPRELYSTTDYTYDAEGRVSRETITYSWDRVVENVWEYDEWGNLIYYRGMPEGDWDEMEERYEYRPLSQVLE